ncbi:hypothetical protein [Nocardia albiluteola]|nr:hypothetical protein [Nocardia albiluteola]
MTFDQRHRRDTNRVADRPLQWLISALLPIAGRRDGGAMTKISKLSAPERRRMAEGALDSIVHRSEHVLVHVRCGRGHHIAMVFDTPAGPVFQSAPGPHAHGARDFVDTAHGAHRHGSRYVDLLAGDDTVDDALPASCECGPYTLSRARLQQAIADHQHTIQLP